MYVALSFAFLTIKSFPQLLKCETDMVSSDCILPYLQCCYALVVIKAMLYITIESVS